jgi:hypothetical protein
MGPGPDIAPLAAHLINKGLIASHWEDGIRPVTSIRTIVTAPK